MIKIVETPEHTSYYPEFAFHLVKDKKEMENIIEIMNGKKPFIVMQTVDAQSFLPVLFFAIPDDKKPFSNWLKYVTTLELMVGVNA